MKLIRLQRETIHDCLFSGIHGNMIPGIGEVQPLPSNITKASAKQPRSTSKYGHTYVKVLYMMMSQDSGYRSLMPCSRSHSLVANAPCAAESIQSLSG